MTIADDAPYDLKNSKLHLPLKNQPGEDGADRHDSASDTAELPSDVKAAIKDGDDETQIAGELKAALKSSDA